MPSLSDRLKALGVQVGTKGLAQPHPSAHNSIENLLNVRQLENKFGETYAVETSFPPDYIHGKSIIYSEENFSTYSTWARDQRISDLSLNSFAFIDTETTGLSGGMGTFAFLIGIGRFDGGEFHLAQYFMQDPIEEPAQLYALEEFFCNCEAIVTYNGKAFDIPLLKTRFLSHGWKSPFDDQPHIDLLHLARRLWRDRIPSRTLSNLEYQILEFSRTEDDVPGWIIPQIYFDYLRSGDARPLKSVFYHNAMDILSLAALFNYTAGILANPSQTIVKDGVDVIALGKLFEDLGEIDTSIDLFIQGLEKELPRSVLIDGLQRLAKIHKRNNNYPKAIQLWKWAAGEQDLESHIELAKFYEHKAKDYKNALMWTSSAIELIESESYPNFLKIRLFHELEHRLSRLENKYQNSKES